ncbi:hypothetical protein Nepgr_004048 [Nepenthes gracilis]|uniref:Uncharacterized protein n=1 Tax=Nepenthes gracilis TaxID=150966 RepID=A0AAD3S0Q6_NEPGR|nr:hypothetical protein Nepgr_004048 [Nepenthes gracilis]
MAPSTTTVRHFSSRPSPIQGARGWDMTNHISSRSPQPHQRPSCFGNGISIPSAYRTAKPSRSIDKHRTISDESIEQHTSNSFIWELQLHSHFIRKENRAPAKTGQGNRPNRHSNKIESALTPSNTKSAKDRS